MRTVSAIVGLSALIWTGSAGAQHAVTPKEYPLTVSVHEDAPRLTDGEVHDILNGASDLLKKCHVSFKLKASVGTFSSAPARITNAADRKAVYAVPADVKVVSEVLFCNPSLNFPFFNGCAYPFRTSVNSMIVTHAHAATTALRSILWAHEFGHRTGLPHRVASNALMTSCPNLSGDQVELTEHECECFREGPGSNKHCRRRSANPQCSSD